MFNYQLIPSCRMVKFHKLFYCHFVLITHWYLQCNGLSISEIRDIFRTKSCIEGSLSSLSLHGSGNLPAKEWNRGTVFNITTLGKKKNVEKSSLSKLNELAQFNDLEYYFKLEKEDGPSHDKTFTVSLTIGDETYVSVGRSLKRAKQNVAAQALVETDYETPVSKEKSEEINIESQTPTVLLNNLGSKLGLPVQYVVLDKLKQDIMKSNVIVEKSKIPYTQKLNDSIYDERSLRMKKDIDQVKGPFNVKVQVGDFEFFGGAHTIQQAKHDAASKALEYFIQNKDHLDLNCLKEGSEIKCSEAKQTIKSPISLLYESAQVRKLDVEFEIIREYGPNHKKIFVTEFRLGHLKATGEGHSKKESKRIAAESMLEKMTELEPIPQEVHVNSMLKDKKKKKKRNKNKMIKTKFDDISMTIGNIMNSVTSNFGGISSKFDQVEDGEDNNSEKKSKNKGPRRKQNKKSYQDQILEISNFLSFEISYNDLDEENKNVALLSLHINPEYLCYGEGLNLQDARNKASDNGMDLLTKMGIFDHYVDQKYSILERETKGGIQNVLHYEVSKEKEEL